jgi:hypothetical protein
MGDLDREYRYYLANKPSLLERYRGKFLVIAGEQVLGAYDSHDAALAEALRSHAAGTFLVQECAEEEQVMRFHSRVSFSRA